MTQDEELLDRVLEVVYLLQDDMRRSLGRVGLTTSRVPVVWTLHRQGASTQRALADALAVTPRNVTGLVDALVATGFVTREPHPTDRRATLVTLTPRGAEVAQGLEADHASLAGTLFEGMPVAERRGLSAGLDRVLDVLRQQLGAAVPR